MPEPLSAADQAKAKIERDLAYWRERAGWTDTQFLADYCRNARDVAIHQVIFIEQGIAAEKAVEDIIKQTGSEEG